MANNKDIVFRKIRNFVKRKSYPEDISKNKGKKANFGNSSKNFKIIDGHLTYKGKRSVINETFNTTMRLYLTLFKYLFTKFELQANKSFKYFNITILHYFLFTRKIREYLFPKGVLIYQENTTTR